MDVGCERKPNLQLYRVVFASGTPGNVLATSGDSRVGVLSVGWLPKESRIYSRQKKKSFLSCAKYPLK
jgi:hypothetical protein